MKTISKSISKNGQSLDYKEIIEFDGKKIRILIRSDSVEKQCFARVYLFDGFKWNIVDYTEFSNMKTPPKLSYIPVNQPNKIDELTLLLNNEKFFKADRDYLVSVFKELVL